MTRAHTGQWAKTRSALLLALACSLPVWAQNAPSRTVGAGDTATALALELRPEGATLEQTLVALWRANPRAFANGNLNQLLQGATLQLPSEREILRLSAAEAHALVIEQVENFQAFARQQKRPASAASEASARAVDTAQWTRALAEAQALKSALERQNLDTANRLAQLEKNIQALQAMQSASVVAASPVSTPASSASDAPASEASAPKLAASGPDTAASAPEAAASAAVTEPASVPAAPSSTPATRTQPLLWTAALLVFMLGVTLFIRQRNRKAPAPAPIEIPPQMARIDLNLDSPATGDASTVGKRP